MSYLLYSNLINDNNGSFLFIPVSEDMHNEFVELPPEGLLKVSLVTFSEALSYHFKNENGKEDERERCMDEHTELRQMQKKEEMRQVQEQRMSPPHFPWPTSKPGPLETPPPPGQKSMPTRTEQMIEVGYNQETGVPATDDPRKWYPDETKVGPTGFDELETAQEVDRKRKRRK